MLREGAAGQVTAFQTQNAHGVGHPVELESSLRNGLDNSDGIFVEIYEERFWEAEVGGPVLDPGATGRTIAEWADTFHTQRRSLWPNLPDPFPTVHRRTFTRTAGPGSNPQLFSYIHGSKCGKTGTTNFGVIAVLPQGVPTPTITPTPVATATRTPTNTATPANTATGTATATSTPAATSTATFSNTPEPTATASHTRTATVSVTRAPTSTATPSRSATSIATPTAAPSPSATATRTAVPCVGDCGADGEVTVDELIRGVTIALGAVSVSTCPSFDVNRDRSVTVDELVVAVNAALRGCPSVS